MEGEEKGKVRGRGDEKEPEALVAALEGVFNETRRPSVQDGAICKMEKVKRR